MKIFEVLKRRIAAKMIAAKYRAQGKDAPTAVYFVKRKRDKR